MARPPPPPPAPVRLRLVFENRRLLRRAERDEGLRRCWLLLRPEIATVADLAAHVAARFRLRRSCPGGVVLSVDGFALPPFESICIFRDKDIIRVKQKSCKKLGGHNDVHCIQDPEVVEKRPLPVDHEILAIEYQKDGSKYQEEEEDGDRQPEENATVSHNIENNGACSKRKCHDGVAGIPEIKRKKLKVANSGKHIDDSKEDNVQQYQDQSGSKNLMLSAIDIETQKETLQPETTATSMEQPKAERNNQTELKCETEAADCNAQSDIKKSESRSARRKKIKRQLRQKSKLQTEKNVHEDSPIAADCPSPSNQDSLPGPSNNQNGSHVPCSSHKADEEESDTSDEIVPVVVRPGHIRFEPAGGQPDKSPAKEIQGTFQWSGTMSKKKGQKWGMNNSNKKYADIGAGSSMEANHHFIDRKITENDFCAVSNQKDDESSNIKRPSVKTIANEEKFNGEPLDFESLYPLTRLPKEGDLIAYRLVELSSSLCPELSSYRVGKVLIYDPISLRIILLPVPEHPMVTTEENKPEGESDMFMDLSPYKEDGSLEIEYSSLLDVRLLKGIESVPGVVSTPSAEICKGGSLAGKTVTLDDNEGKIDCQKPGMVPNNTKDQEATLETCAEKTENTVWEENVEPSNDKTDVQENGWGTWKRNASTSAWSYRALRSSALGPTMAMLRGKNSQRGKPPCRKYGK
ncbi:coilin isoform X1 [Setaria italica]|uniref:coilin isoform X1 n=1 Tax=Setaria italica TaxID=4555 RepID=UPI000BE5CB05|nr:coilin isoform X1 [Setaria italica]